MQAATLARGNDDPNPGRSARSRETQAAPGPASARWLGSRRQRHAVHGAVSHATRSVANWRAWPGTMVPWIWRVPRNEHGGGQVSHLLLGPGQFGSRRLCVTWVECQPGSQQALHRHPAQEQVYVIVRGQGQMLLGDEERTVVEGTMVFVPPGADHAIRNASSGMLVYVSATAPPFAAAISGQTWEPRPHKQLSRTASQQDQAPEGQPCPRPTVTHRHRAGDHGDVLIRAHPRRSGAAPQSSSGGPATCRSG